MTLFEASMHYERIFGYYSTLHNKVQEEYSKERRRAAAEGREPDTSYEERLKNIKEKKVQFRKLSDTAFLKHKMMHPDIDEDGFDNLIIAIMQRAALDYGTALSEKDLVAQGELERFAAGYGQELTSIDVTNLFEHIKFGYKRFCQIVVEHPLDIIAYNKEIASKREDGERRFQYKYHCPICKGQITHHSTGRQAKRVGTAFRCNHCNFVREVMLG